MEEALQPPVSRKQNRGFILGCLAFGHGVSHLYDQGLPVYMPAIASAMNLNNLQVASLLGVRQGGFSVVNLGGGVFVDMLRNQWGLILTGCIVMSAYSFTAVGVSPNFPLLVVAIMFVSVPGALWHLPATAALSQRFPDRRGFAVSMHGFGSNIGNVLGPLLAGALLSVFFWRAALLMYGPPALLLASFVWWSLKDIGREGRNSERKPLSAQFREAGILVRNPVVLGLVLAATVRGIGMNALMHWTPFYLKLEEELGMGHLSVGIYYGLLTGMGIVSAPILGTLADRFGRKKVLVPGLFAAATLAMLVVHAGDGVLLALVLAGSGLFLFTLHQIILAAALDVTGRGAEATATGLIFGLSGAVGALSPFIATVIIDHLGGYGSVYYYAGILTAVSALIVMFLPMPPRGAARAGPA